jgi:CheY-like chemotaxis protein
MAKNCAPLLIIEDSDEDYEATIWAFQQAGVTTPSRRCRTGAEALAYLRPEGACADPMLPFPCLIILDLNLPGVDGRALLRDLHHDAERLPVPVIVLSTSANPQDVTLCYRLGACGYLVKPVDLPRFAAMIRVCADYWLTTVILPETSA